MKIMHEHIDFPLGTAVKVKNRKMPYFTYPWHFHNEYEILYILKGRGTSFVADHTESFQAGDLVMLGSNLPHFWRSDKECYKNENSGNVHYIVIQFPNDLFRGTLFHYPESHSIRELLNRSSRGIRFSGAFSKSIEEHILNMTNSLGFTLIVNLLQLLQIFAETSRYRILASELYQEKTFDFHNDRLTKIFHYINTHYQQKIELDKVAEIAHLHPSACCRYFRKKTGKSLTAYIHDLRIGYACKLIIEGRLTMSQICFESGFNNLSNFNRIFRKMTNLTPSEYFNKFHSNN